MSAAAPTFTEKALALEVVECMPDSGTLEDICDELATLAAILARKPMSRLAAW